MVAPEANGTTLKGIVMVGDFDFQTSQSAVRVDDRGHKYYGSDDLVSLTTDVHGDLVANNSVFQCVGVR